MLRRIVPGHSNDTGLFSKKKGQVFTIQIDDDLSIKYRTATEYGNIVGFAGLKHANPYDPGTYEYEEFSEGRQAGINKKLLLDKKMAR